MVKLHVIKRTEDYHLFLKTADEEQIFIVGSILNEEKDPIAICRSLYEDMIGICQKHDIVIFHERVFGSLELYEPFGKVRGDIYDQHQMEDIPFSYMDGTPYWGEGIAGVQIHGIVLKESSTIETIYHQEQPMGRRWENQEATYLMLHGVHSPHVKEDPCEQTKSMFETGHTILQGQGFTFKEVIRTWIYLHHILDQYDAFNVGRTAKFREFGLLPMSMEDDAYEAVYMPASTGISCNNPYGASGQMDILAVKPKRESVLKVTNETGKKQKSAYRYGSAFSRAMVLENNTHRYIYLSGTASINSSGETVYLDDIKKQIDMTVSVIDALAKKNDLGIQKICEGTVFLKKPEYIHPFQDFIQSKGLTELPFIITVADVCRDNLLFEIDATLLGEK